MSFIVPTVPTLLQLTAVENLAVRICSETHFNYELVLDYSLMVTVNLILYSFSSQHFITNTCMCYLF